MVKYPRLPSNYFLILIFQDSKVEDFVPIPLAEEFSKINISLDVDKSVVPKTHGTRRKPSDEVSFELVLHIYV